LNALQNLKIITTEDGSHSLQLPELNETYHSIHGAIQEAKHVFIKSGLDNFIGNNTGQASIRILEFGFGTGLNVMLAAQESSTELNITYHTLEKYPLPKAIYRALNYGEILKDEALFHLIHSASWEQEIIVKPGFALTKMETDFRNFSTDIQYEIIFYDAFAPEKQPELWAKSIFDNCHRILKKGGLLVTYSAKGQLKRDLRSVGFMVESLPGPPGKFEITRARKP
jgi:tRNA U34 5-methylaminomethyl-2-thiouridine-forming methyltransferase MnmC